MNTKENPFRAKLSKASWDALRTASIAGTSDSDLSAVYEIAEGAIRAKRFKDKTWAVAHGLRRKALGGQGAVSQHVSALILTKGAKGNNYDLKSAENTEKSENQSIQAMGATFADESQVTRMLALQIGRKGMQAALEGDGSLKPMLQPTEPAHVKVYADIAAKAGSWQPETSITVNCQAFAGASLARNDENENTIMDI